MDSQMMQQVMGWVQENVGDRTSKQELVEKSQRSNLPDEAKGVFQQLPEGTHDKQTIIQQVQEKLTAGVTGGGMGSMFGR